MELEEVCVLKLDVGNWLSWLDEAMVAGVVVPELVNPEPPEPPPPPPQAVNANVNKNER